MTSPATVPHTATAAKGAGEGPGILWVFPDLAGRPMPFLAPRVVIGRDGVGPARLDGSEISRLHAEVERQGMLSVLRDLGSTNGTFLNGLPVKEAPVLPGDVVRAGEWVGIVLADLGSKVGAFSALAPGLYAGPALTALLAPVRAAAAGGGLPIVLEGETGTGKECVARAIHVWSGRTGPFVAINCAALPEAVAEAELFGHRPGAFPGAVGAGLGHLRAAHGGTLLLDEIVELPLAVQAKFLRSLEQREVVPLGETSPIPIDVQVVAASQISLAQAVKDKRFRADLLGRLDGLTVRLPPLRERIEDVPYLLSRLWADQRPNAPAAVSSALIDQLCVYDWPLNVRELHLLVKRLCQTAASGSPLGRDVLPERIQSARRGATPPEAVTPAVVAPRAAGAGSGTGEAPTTKNEVMALAAALEASGGNVAKAATMLGISRQRAYRLIELARDLDLTSLRLAGDDPRLKSRARREGGSE